MPFRFRRSFHIAPGIRLNVVRRGLFRFRCRIRLAPGIRWNVGRWGLLRFRRSFRVAPGVRLTIGRRGPFRFRHSIRLAPGIRLNIGKRGLSTSLGDRVARVTAGRNARATVSAPGTILSSATRPRSSATRPRRSVNVVTVVIWGGAAGRCCRHDGAAVLVGVRMATATSLRPGSGRRSRSRGRRSSFRPSGGHRQTPPVNDEPDGRSISGQCRQPDRAGSCRTVGDRHHDQPQAGEAAARGGAGSGARRRGGRRDARWLERAEWGGQAQ